MAKRKITLPSLTGKLLPSLPKDSAVQSVVRHEMKERGKPCRTTWVVAKCFLPKTGKGKRKQVEDWKAHLKKTENDDAVLRPACARASGEYQEGFYKPRRVGSVELALLSPKQARAAKTTPGPHVRLCYKDIAQGVLVPVKTARELKAVSDEFKKCVGKDRAKEQTCARNFLSRGTLGRLKRR